MVKSVGITLMSVAAGVPMSLPKSSLLQPGFSREWWDAELAVADSLCMRAGSLAAAKFTAQHVSKGGLHKLWRLFLV